MCGQVIVYPTQDSVKRFGALISLLTVWLVSLLLAGPLAVFNVLKVFELESVVLYETCVENTDLVMQRRAYSLASIVFQYSFPVVIVSVAHARISHKLRSRMVTLQQRNTAPSTDTSSTSRRHQQTSTATTTCDAGGRTTLTVPLTTAQKEKRRLAKQRKRKTTLLLVMIAVVFALSWLPLNVCNIVTDFDIGLLQRFDTQVYFYHFHYITLTDTFLLHLEHTQHSDHLSPSSSVLFCRFYLPSVVSHFTTNLFPGVLLSPASTDNRHLAQRFYFLF